MSCWLVGVLAGAVVGLGTVPVLESVGTAQLTGSANRSPGRLLATATTGALSGAAAAVAVQHAGSWWWLPALVVWACTLGASAACDARTQRIPTPLVRQGSAITGVLVTVAAAATADWRGLAVSLAACASAGLILVACWRFVGAGLGDVRLAVLGGLGLGHSSYRSLAAGVGAFAVLTTCQAVWTLARARDRRATFPYGPALAVGFLIAAAI